MRVQPESHRLLLPNLFERDFCAPRNRLLSAIEFSKMNL
jgi:hypothetical protein